MTNKNPIVLSKIAGSKGDIKITINRATFHESEDNSLESPHPEFAEWLVEQVFNWEKILATKSGLFTKKYFCPACKTELNPSLRTSLESSYNLEFMDFSPFSMSVRMPSVICPQCNKTCGIDLKGSFESDFVDAIIDAFNSANIRP